MDSNKNCRSTLLEVNDHLENTYCNDIKKDVLSGLTAAQKFIPSKYFYDARGSQLFEEICSLSEYYPTRTEMTILEHVAGNIMESFQRGDLIELGSGANWKIRMLLDAVEKSRMHKLRYIPVDVSNTALIKASEELKKIYPDLRVLGIVADFTRHMEVVPNGRPKLIILFGSTIGNFSRLDSLSFLQKIAGSMKTNDRLLIGLDLVKPKETLETAYNDSQGITSEFNKNVLNVLNRELNADFDLSHFDHLAFFNEGRERIEMHLRANREISVEIDDLGITVEMEKNETIQTEICRKFTRNTAEHMASEAGLTITQWFSDTKEWFALAELKLKKG